MRVEWGAKLAPGLLSPRRQRTRSLFVADFDHVKPSSKQGPREPGMGANVFRRSPTHRDPLGSFALVRGSPPDSSRALHAEADSRSHGKDALTRTFPLCIAAGPTGIQMCGSASQQPATRDAR